MSDIKIKAGKNWELEVPVVGEPVPTTKWDMNGSSLEDSPRFVCIHTPHKAKLSLHDAKREDSGELQLVASNVNGTDRQTVKFTVVDVPTAPEGLAASNVTKDGCELSWRKPKDDGGCNILHYVVEKKDIDSGNWTMVAETPSLTCKVDRLIEGQSYLFRVKAVNHEGDSPYCTIKEPVLAKNPYGKFI